jgi:hypothetical protein
VLSIFVKVAVEYVKEKVPIVIIIRSIRNKADLGSSMESSIERKKVSSVRCAITEVTSI